jgi:apolipoprotein N-acyltransferase
VGDHIPDRLGGILRELDLATPCRALWVEFPPADPTGGGRIRREDKGVLIDPDGSILFVYRKGNSDPGSRSVHGDAEFAHADTDFGIIGAAICYDTVRPEFFLSAGTSHTALLAVPTWDSPEIENLHMAMTRLRAVENGFALLFSPREGYSAAFDGLGRLSALSGRNPPDRTMLSDVPVGSLPSFYPVLGDWLGWFWIAGLIVLTAAAVAGANR